jgi:hypothetical protein
VPAFAARLAIQRGLKFPNGRFPRMLDAPPHSQIQRNRELIKATKFNFKIVPATVDTSVGAIYAVGLLTMLVIVRNVESLAGVPG